MFRRYLCAIAATIASAGLAAHSSAAVMDYSINLNSSDPNSALLAQAHVVSGDGWITVTLTNNVVNQKSVAQSITGLQFTLDAAPLSASLTGIDGRSRTINPSTRAYTDSTTDDIADDSWTLNVNGAAVTLDGLTGQGNDKWPIVGLPNPANNHYDNANASMLKLKTSGGHANPGMSPSATFYIAAEGVTELTTILSGSVRFWFNTTGDAYSATQSVVSPIPEPATFALFGLGALLMTQRRRSSITVN